MLLQHFFRRQAEIQAPPDSRRRSAQMLRPVNETHCVSVVSEHSGGAPIPGLLGAGSPSAVARLIVAVIVDALDRVRWRRLPAHVGKEVRVIVQPAVTDGNTSASVPLKSAGRLVVAPANHIRPADVFGRELSASRRAVGRRSGPRKFSLQASTTSRRSALEVVRSSQALRAAGTLAVPDAECHSGQVVGCCAFHLASMCESMMRLTSSAMEMPSRFASRFKNALCGSVNEIICLVIVASRAALWRVNVKRPVIREVAFFRSSSYERGEVSSLLEHRWLTAAWARRARAAIMRPDDSVSVYAEASKARLARLRPPVANDIDADVLGPLGRLVASGPLVLGAETNHWPRIPRGITQW